MPYQDNVIRIHAGALQRFDGPAGTKPALRYGHGRREIQGIIPRSPAPEMEARGLPWG